MKEAKKIQIRSYVHATEDESKVLKAIGNTIGPSFNKVKVARQRVYGYYKNPIIILSVNIEDKELTREAENYLFSKIDEESKKHIVNTLTRRTKKKKLYLRLDKQEAYLNRLRIREKDDVIRIEISYKGKLDMEEFTGKIFKT